MVPIRRVQMDLRDAFPATTGLKPRRRRTGQLAMFRWQRRHRRWRRRRRRAVSGRPDAIERLRRARGPARAQCVLALAEGRVVLHCGQRGAAACDGGDALSERAD
jgi:hypothetical protein